MSELKPMKHLLLILLAISFPFLASFFLVLRGVIFVFLKLKHGDDLYGLMDGFETIWEMHDTSRGQITILATFDYDATKNGDVLECMKKQIFQPELRRSCRKAATRRRQILGYNYLIEMDPYDGLVQAMASYECEEDIRRILSVCSNEPIGIADDKMLEFYVGVKPIRFAGSTKLLYPIIMKMHHCLGDGVALMNLCITGLGRDPAAFLQKTDAEFRKMFKIKNDDEKHAQVRITNEMGLWQLGKLLRRVMTSRFYHPLFGRPDANLLHGKALTGRKVLVWGCDMSGDYVRTVKNIKSRFDAVSFNTVLYTALAASFSEFYQKHDPENVPEYITNGIVLLPSIPKFEDLVYIRNGRVESLDLSNKFVVAFLKLPLVSKGNINEHIVELLGRVKREIASLSQSLDILLTVFFMKYFAYIMPIPFCKFILNYFDSTISVSNLPGHGRLQMFHGGHINDLYFWVPNVKKIGIGISMFSYDNCLRIGLIADEAIISHTRDAQEIVDNVFKYLDVLDASSQLEINNNISEISKV